LSYKEDIEELRICLSSYPKKIPSRFFYDELGDKYFQEIMNLPEYYLTRTENLILKRNTGSIFNKLIYNKRIRFLEPGAGDGSKFAILYKALENKKNFIYSPIDISANVLQILERNLKNEFLDLSIEPIISDYKHIKSHIPEVDEQKVLLFLGSNLGNYTPEESIEYLNLFTDCLKENDLFLLGVDLVKDPNLILSAYNDAAGVTSEFNLNLLKRLNSLLKTDFNIDDFFHFPTYNPVLQQAESYLVCKENRVIYSQILKENFHFQKFEPIFTEISRKFRIKDIEFLARTTNMEILEVLTDREEKYCCTLWRKGT
jgi:dimethylhistidine N-methyltransferase